MNDKTFGELFRERYTTKPDCFGKIDFDSDKCGKCHVTGQCMNARQEITIVNLNQLKLDTCGSCVHTDNNIGVVAMHCQLIYNDMLADIEHDGEDYDWGKVRSWDDCYFKPSRYVKGEVLGDE